MAEQVLIPGSATAYAAATAFTGAELTAIVDQINNYEILPPGIETWYKLLKTSVVTPPA